VTITTERSFKDFPRTNIPEKGVLVLGPGVDARIDVTTPILMNDAQIAGIRLKVARVFVYGAVTYKIPGGRGESGFCYFYDLNSEAFASYEQGNYAK